MNEMHLPPGTVEDIFRPYDPYWRVKLPGHNPEEAIFVDVVDFIPSYEIGETIMKIDDPVWGEETLDADRTTHDGRPSFEPVLIALAKHPAMTRLMSLEHLTLPPSMSTVPNTSFMSTWEHAWGSLVAVRRLLESDGQDVTTRESVGLQLRTLLSDAGKTAFGHLGDWRFQGFGGSEDLHDKDLKDYVRRCGLADLLDHFGFSVDEVIFPPVKDFVENDAPEICVDRLDYTLRERRRYLGAPENSIDWSNAIKLVDGKIVFKTQEAASIYARGNLLLPVINWQEPVHKLNLHLLVEMINRISVLETEMSFGYPDTLLGDYHPYDLMYSFDHDFVIPTKTSDPFLWTVRPIVDQLGREMRHINHERASYDMGAIAIGAMHDFDAMKYRGMPRTPSNVQIFDVTGLREEEIVQGIPDYQRHPNAVDVYMPHLKPRKHTDPLVECEDGEIRPLSKLDPRYLELAESAAKRITTDHVARLLVNPETKDIIESGMRENREIMPQLMKRQRMPEEIFRRAVHGNFTASDKKADLLWAD
jgi:hypothetical protein